MTVKMLYLLEAYRVYQHSKGKMPTAERAANLFKSLVDDWTLHLIPPDVQNDITCRLLTICRHSKSELSKKRTGPNPMSQQRANNGRASQLYSHTDVTINVDGAIVASIEKQRASHEEEVGEITGLLSSATALLKEKEAQHEVQLAQHARDSTDAVKSIEALLGALKEGPLIMPPTFQKTYMDASATSRERMLQEVVSLLHVLMDHLGQMGIVWQCTALQLPSSDGSYSKYLDRESLGLPFTVLLCL
jgi:hypothetical protein